MADLSRNQHKAIRALLTTRTIQAAATACGLVVRTIYNYLRQPAFLAELRARQDALTGATTAALAGGVGLALDTLAYVMVDPEATPAARVRAAVAWLTAWRNVAELDDLTQRITDLEAKQ